MKKTFYGAQAEFYVNGSSLLHIIERTCKKEPKNQHKETPIGSFYIDWFESRELAEAFISERTLKTA
jgi:hypothetical protein